jgi:hypothetical protein
MLWFHDYIRHLPWHIPIIKHNCIQVLKSYQEMGPFQSLLVPPASTGCHRMPVVCCHASTYPVQSLAHNANDENLWTLSCVTFCWLGHPDTLSKLASCWSPFYVTVVLTIILALAPARIAPPGMSLAHSNPCSERCPSHDSYCSKCSMCITCSLLSGKPLADTGPHSIKLLFQLLCQTPPCISSHPCAQHRSHTCRGLDFLDQHLSAGNNECSHHKPQDYPSVTVTRSLFAIWVEPTGFIFLFHIIAFSFQLSDFIFHVSYLVFQLSYSRCHISCTSFHI